MSQMTWALHATYSLFCVYIKPWDVYKQRICWPFIKPHFMFLVLFFISSSNMTHLNYYGLLSHHLCRYQAQPSFPSCSSLIVLCFHVLIFILILILRSLRSSLSLDWNKFSFFFLLTPVELSLSHMLVFENISIFLYSSLLWNTRIKIDIFPQTILWRMPKITFLFTDQCSFYLASYSLPTNLNFKIGSLRFRSSWLIFFILHRSRHFKWLVRSHTTIRLAP